MNLAVQEVSLGARSWSRWTTECRLVVTDAATVDRAFVLAGEVMDDVEAAIDWFNPSSELSRLHAGVNAVSPTLAWFLEVALTAAEQTGGLLDPTVGSRPAGWRNITLDEAEVTLPPGVVLDLGSTGKAAAADLVARRVNRALGVGVLVSLGGDIATAGRGPAEGWQVEVRDSDAVPSVTVALAPGAAVATSSTLHRRWVDVQGIERHHIIDPRSGSSAEGPWCTATVVAPTCVEANTASTTAIVQGPDAVEWLTSLALPARLVSRDGAVTTVNGFPEAEDR